MIESEFHTMGRKHNKAPVAVLIHGLASSYRSWDSTVVFLMKEGYNVLTLDLSGHGRSGKRKTYSFDSWVQDVTTTLTKYKIKKIDLLVGHSLGGLISAGVSTAIPTDKVAFLDPLLSVPPRLMRMVFKRIMQMRTSTTLTGLISRFPQRDPQQLLNEFEATQKWDVKSLEAVKATDGLRIVTKFLNETEQTKKILLRPVDSKLIPKNKIKFFEKHGITVINVKNVGHGLHHDDKEMFEGSLKAFISN